MTTDQDPKDLNALLQRCCGELPEGFILSVCAERGAAWVELEDDWGEDAELDPDPQGGIPAAIEHALKVAKEIAATRSEEEDEDDIKITVYLDHP